jgi:integrator complex subunit 2
LLCLAQGRGGHGYAHRDLVQDPLAVLRVDRRVWRQPALVDIVLHMAHAYLVAGQADVEQHARAQPLVARQVALTHLRAAAVVQVLLELCHVSAPADAVDMDHGAEHEVGAAICAFIHQVFVAHPACIKLVHFQTYAPGLLRITVPGIPSMHTCADFVPELVARPEPAHRVFGMHLAAALCMQYPVPKTLDAACAAINAAATLPPAALAEALPALATMCQAFPGLAVPVTRVLTAARADTDPALALAPHCDMAFAAIAACL